MLKKIIGIIVTIFLLQTQISYAQNSVTPNIKGGEYNKVIEIYLNGNNIDEKIFYYLNKNDNLNNIIEFQNSPIIIKKDTQLNYFQAYSKEFATKIETQFYSFNYPSNIEIYYENNKLFIKNNENETISLYYRHLKGNNISNTFEKNNYLNPLETISFSYKISNGETINLASPDGKILKSYTYEEEIKNTNLTNKNIEIQQTQNKEEIKKASVDYNAKVEHKVELISFGDILGNTKSSITEYKSQTSEEKNDTKSSLLIWLAISIFIIIIHNFFLNTRKKRIGKIKKIKNKKN